MHLVRWFVGDLGSIVADHGIESLPNIIFDRDPQSFPHSVVIDDVGFETPYGVEREDIRENLIAMLDPLSTGQWTLRIHRGYKARDWYWGYEAGFENIDDAVLFRLIVMTS